MNIIKEIKKDIIKVAIITSIIFIYKKSKHKA